MVNDSFVTYLVLRRTFFEAMSPSKLESLPNEILIEIIDKYINGVDVITALNYQLNRRFDALIAQCYRLRFNFTQCRTDDFRICMGLLPAYRDRIEELVLSEHNTPGQVHAFLSFWPSFKAFKRLRKLYIHYDSETVQWNVVERALRSLCDISISSLSIKIDNETTTHSLSSIFTDDLLCSKTLRRFTLVGNTNPFSWRLFPNISSDIQCLIIPQTHFPLRYLQYIGQWASCLNYLHIGLTERDSSLQNTLDANVNMKITPMQNLRTLILCFKDRDPITVNELAPYLDAMPVLNRLEIEGGNQLTDADVWRMLFETSLLVLTHFTLRTSISRLQDIDIQEMQAMLQNISSKSKKNFMIIINDNTASNFQNHAKFMGYRRDLYGFNQKPVLQCWIASNRTAGDNFVSLDQITSLTLATRSSIVSCPYYFNNVKCLIVDDLDESLFRWVTTHVKCSGITELLITPSSKTRNELPLLLECTPNTKSLHISFVLLILYKDILMENKRFVKYLNLSDSKHPFEEKHIDLIAQLFPHLEYLQISTAHLHNIPRLPHYFSNIFALLLLICRMIFLVTIVFIPDKLI